MMWDAKFTPVLANRIENQGRREEEKLENLAHYLIHKTSVAWNNSRNWPPLTMFMKNR